jgi:hypothetical protein
VTARLGSALDRTSNRDTVDATDDGWVAELRRRKAALAEATGVLEPDQGPTSDGRVLHRCPDGYTSILTLAEVCEACGWSPSLPLPELDECAERLVFVLGRGDAPLWARVLVRRLEVR